MSELVNEFLKIYSREGLEDLVRDTQTAIIQKTKDKDNIGESWTTRKIVCWRNEHESEIYELKEQLELYKKALRIKVNQSSK